MNGLQNRQTLFAIDKITKMDDFTKNFRFKVVKRRCLWTKDVLLFLNL